MYVCVYARYLFAYKTPASVCVCVCMCVYIYMCVGVWVGVCVCACVHMHICMYVRMHVFMKKNECISDASCILAYAK